VGRLTPPILLEKKPTNHRPEKEPAVAAATATQDKRREREDPSPFRSKREGAIPHNGLAGEDPAIAGTPHKLYSLTKPHRSATTPGTNYRRAPDTDDEENLSLDILLSTLYTSVRRFRGPSHSPTPDRPSERRKTTGIAAGRSGRPEIALSASSL